MDQDGKTFLTAFEVYATEQWNWLPNLHLNFWRLSTGEIMCHCIDFDLRTYSALAAPAGLEEAFEGMAELATVHIMGAMSRNTVDRLFEHFPYGPIGSDAFLFSKANNENKVRKLREGYAKFVQRVESEPVGLIRDARRHIPRRRRIWPH